MKIKANEDGTPNEISLDMMNRKLESFVEVLLGKLQEMQIEQKKLVRRVKKLEKALDAKEQI